MIDLTSTEIEHLKILSDRIEYGSANPTDYVAFENLLIKAGYSQDQIRQKMTENRVFSYEQYSDMRINAQTNEQKRVTEAIIAASLIALCFIVLWSIMQQNKKQE